MKSVFIAIPTLGDIRIELAQTIYNWKSTYGDYIAVYSNTDRPLTRARNECVRAFLGSGRSWMLFIDSDVIPPTNTIESLTATLDRPIVTAVGHVFKLDSDGFTKRVPLLLRKVRDRDIPHQPEYKIIEDIPRQQYIEIDAAGMMCVAIHRSVFESIDPPWFDGYFEDFYFYDKAKSNGFKIYADLGVVVRHMVRVAI